MSKRTIERQSGRRPICLTSFTLDGYAGAVDNRIMLHLQDQEAAAGGRRALQMVLVLEDEGLLSMMLEDLLEEAGAQQVLVCRTAEEALAPARSAPLTCAILDVALHGRRTFDVADILADRHIPFLFCTGLARHELAERHNSRPLLPKPYGDTEFEAALAALLGEL